MKYKGFIVCAVLAVVVQTGFAQERDRYFDFGVGSYFINHGKERDAVVTDMKDAGLVRTLVYVDMSYGKALSDNLYIVGSMTGFGDAFIEEMDISVMVNAGFLELLTYLYGVGIRYYPLPSGLHLQLGADVGLASLMTVSTMSGFETGRGPFGVGGKISVSWDFDSDMTGPAFVLGAQLLADFIEKELVLGFSIFAKFVYK
jgi:hypothetical protein